MKFVDYIEDAKKTAMYENDEMQITCSVFGLFGEMYEYVEKVIVFREHKVSLSNMIDELGDISWYLAILCDSFGYIPIYEEVIFSDFTSFEDCICSKGFIPGYLEKFKKLYRKYSYIDAPEEELDFVYKLINKVYTILHNEASWNETTVDSIWEGNIKKLKDRQSRGVLHSKGDNR